MEKMWRLSIFLYFVF